MDWSAPSVTDWIQATGALIGVPGAIAAFILLFRKDKDKQTQLDALTTLASKQDEILAEMRQQLFEFSQQTKGLQEQNRLTAEGNFFWRQQVELQGEHLEFTKTAAVETQRQIKEERRKNIMPTFIYKTHRPGFNFDSVYITLLNDGRDTAKKIGFLSYPTYLKIYSQAAERSNPNTANKDQTITVVVDFVGKVTAQEQYEEFYFTLAYEDIDGTPYTQRISYKKMTVKIDDPVLPLKGLFPNYS